MVAFVREHLARPVADTILELRPICYPEGYRVGLQNFVYVGCSSHFKKFG